MHLFPFIHSSVTYSILKFVWKSFPYICKSYRKFDIITHISIFFMEILLSPHWAPCSVAEMVAVMVERQKLPLPSPRAGPGTSSTDDGGAGVGPPGRSWPGPGRRGRGGEGGAAGCGSTAPERPVCGQVVGQLVWELIERTWGSRYDGGGGGNDLGGSSISRPREVWRFHLVLVVVQKWYILRWYLWSLLIPMCYLLFWNQVLTWVSLRPSLLARLPRSSTLQFDQDQFLLGSFFIGRHTHDQKVINTDINISKYCAGVFHV